MSCCQNLHQDFTLDCVEEKREGRKTLQDAANRRAHYNDMRGGGGGGGDGQAGAALQQEEGCHVNVLCSSIQLPLAHTEDLVSIMKIHNT